MSSPSDAIADYNPMINPDRDDPFARYHRLRQEAPVAYCPAFDLWLVTRYDDLCAILQDVETFSTEGSTSFIAQACPEVAAMLVEAEVDRPAVLTDPPAVHTRRRAIVTKAFTPQRVAAMEPRIRRLAEQYIGRFEAGGCVELMDHYAYPFPISVLSMMLGVPDDQIELMWQGGIALRILMGEPSPPERQREYARTILELRELLSRLIEERRARATDDILGALVMAQDDDGAALTDAELIRLCLTLSVAGHFTTTHMLGNMMKLVLGSDGAWARFVNDRSLARAIVEETLRAEGSVRGMFRRTTREVELGGVTMPQGALVQIMFGSANRDEATFPEPDRFDIDRAATMPHLGFGRGVHFCIGAALARLQARVTLVALAERLPGLRLTPDREVPYNPNIWAWGPDALHVEWDRPTA